MTAAVAAAGRTFERILGRVRGDAPGPTLVVCGGIHGNEPAGALAAQRVAAELVARGTPLRGAFTAVAGNLAGLAGDRRYLRTDLNRLWTQERVDALLAADPRLDVDEDAEQRALIGVFEDEQRAARGDVAILDLHTTSSAGPPFCIFSDTLPNREAALQLGIPAILGLEECIDGTLLDHATKTGMIAFVVEGGQHADPGSVRRHEAAIWLTLVALGCVDARDVPDLAGLRAELARATAGMPRAVEIRYRHALQPGDAFAMRPGYSGFQPVAEGEVLAAQRGADVRSPLAGRILMPLYQAQGDDGFFIVRDVRPFWLGVSTWLRRLGVPALVPLLPGVRQHPERPDWIVVRPRVARFYRSELLHLLGFRTRSVTRDAIVFARRRRRRPGHA